MAKPTPGGGRDGNPLEAPSVPSLTGGGTMDKVLGPHEGITLPGFTRLRCNAEGGRGRRMNKVQLKKFKTLLTEKRDEIVKKAKQTLEEDMSLDANDLPDEMDLASSEYLQSFTFRLRGREKVFLDKIEKALRKIEDGSFGTCEECSEEISVKRLEARPETTLCIRCKEDQERMEKDYT
jgi:DnaK suppressor protein